MAKMRYIKFYPGDFLLGTEALNDEQCALYVRLLCHMHIKGGAVAFEPQQLKFVLKKRPQDIRRLVDQLVKLGKLSIDAENMIHNSRVDAEIEEWMRNERKMAEKWSDNGAPNGGSARPKTQQNLRAHARSPARSQESEAESESLSWRDNSSGSPRELTIAEAVRLRRAELEREEKRNDRTSDPA